MWRRQGLPDNIRAMPSRTATRPRELRSHQVAQHVGAIQHFAEPFGQQGRGEIEDEGSPPCCLEQVAHLVVVACDGRNGQAAERGGCRRAIRRSFLPALIAIPDPILSNQTWIASRST
jgi:hypothetical protein